MKNNLKNYASSLNRLLKVYSKLLSIFILSFLILSPINAQDASRTVSGVIKDEFGETVIGASVIIKGTTTGSITDLDGRFSVKVPGANSTLVISYLGYLAKEIKVGTQTELNLSLTPQTTGLDEVVVIGYGTVKRKDLTGAVSSFKSDDITIAPTSNVMEALQGKVAGMDITKTSGQVGEDVEILLRGSRSLYGSNSPLFIIDGIPGSYSNINPSDVESIDVLRDASSTAIYGSAGANGVIMITTKKGVEGKASVNFDAYVGFSGNPKFHNGMQGDEWTRYQREAYKYKNNGQYPADMGTILTDAQQLDAYNQGKWIDWVDEASGRTAVDQKYDISVRAGGDRTRIFASLSYDHRESLLENDNSDKYSMRLNIDQEVFKWAKVGFLTNLAYRKGNIGARNTFTKSLAAFPLGDAYDEDGNLNHEYVRNEYSPLGDLIDNQHVNSLRTTDINANAYLELTPIAGLSFKTLVGGTLGDSRAGRFWGAKAVHNKPNYGVGFPHAEVDNIRQYEYLWDNVLSYTRDFGKHTIGGTLISSWEHAERDNNLAASNGQIVDSWSFYRLQAGAPGSAQSGYRKNQKMSYAIRLNYSYMSKYLLTLSNRWDGVSHFSEGEKWDSFPAAAVAWRVSEEKFMSETTHWLDNLKLRVGYGVTGTSGGGQLGAYLVKPNLNTLTSSGLTLDGNQIKNAFTQYESPYGSPKIGWEKSYNINVGLDFSLFNNRIDGTIDWYDTRTKDILYKRTIPITNGLSGWGKTLYRWENLAETKNTGVEITLNSRNIETKDFSWGTTLNFTWGKEEIISLPTGDLEAEGLFIGQPMRAHYDYKYQGIWGTDTPADILKAYGGVKPGWVKIATNPMIDANGNSDDGVHKYSDKDRQILGHLNPDYIVGLNNNFRYRDFDLNVFIMSRHGQTIRSKLLGWYDASDKVSQNQIAGTDYWTEDNQNAYYPVAGSGGEQSGRLSALQYRDGSFIKVKNITLGYTLPKQISQKAKMERLRFYGTAYNPFIFVKDKQLKGTDPETNGSDSFPLYAQFVFGVNISF